MKKSKLVAWGLASLLASAAFAATGTLPNLDATLKAQRKLVDAHPNDAVAHNDLGNLLEESGDLAGAELAYQKAIALDSQAVAAHFNLALLYQQQKKDRKAIDTLEQLLEIDGQHAWAHYQLGVLFERRGRRGAAIEQYARAFALDTGLSFPRNNPQVLDSALATESLLRAESYLHTSENRVPRQFNDAARIRKMMLDEPAKEVVAKEGASEEVSKVAPPEEGGVRPRPAGSAAEGSTNGASGAAGASAEPGVTRVLTNDDLKGGGSSSTATRARSRTTTTASPRGGGSSFVAPAPGLAAPVQKGVPTPMPSRPGGMPNTGVYVPPPPVEQPELVQPTAPINTQVPPDRFRPGRRSTASLDWSLEPTGNAAG